jgi:malonyl CoA-acyl carrier protein transacylase
MFPGQSSRYPGMLERAVALDPTPHRAIVAHASDLLSRDLLAHYREDNLHAFATNRDVQVGVFLTSYLHLLALEGTGVRADLSLGHSLGEYCHLVHIGALDFESALTLVDERGRAYDAGLDGAMVSVFPLDEPALDAILSHGAVRGELTIAAYNSPTQYVLAGETAAAEAAAAHAQEEHYAEAVFIERRVPMHTPRFAPVGRTFAAALQRTAWRQTRLPYLPNVIGQAIERPGTEVFVELLTAHVSRPVRWRDSIELIAKRCPGAAFVEVGPRAVLHNLLSRSWLANRRFATDCAQGGPEDGGAAIGAIASALREEVVGARGG